jgi:hypothetical protein
MFEGYSRNKYHIKRNKIEGEEEKGNRRGRGRGEREGRIRNKSRK